MKARVCLIFLTCFLFFASANSSLDLMSQEVVDPYRLNEPVFNFYVHNNGSSTIEILSANLGGDLEDNATLTELPVEIEPSGTGKISFEKKEKVGCSASEYTYNLSVEYRNDSSSETTTFGPFTKGIENPLVLSADKGSMVIEISTSKNLLIEANNKGSTSIEGVSFSIEDSPDFLYFIITLLEGRYQESGFESNNYVIEGDSVKDLRVQVVPKQPDEGKVTFNMNWNCTPVGPLEVNVESYTVSEGVFDVKTLSGLNFTTVLILSICSFFCLLFGKELTGR